MSVRAFFVCFFSKKKQDLGGAKGDFANKAKRSSNPSGSQVSPPGFAERSSKMYILPTLTYLEVGEPADASEII